MKIAIGQINPVIGDFPGNRQKIISASQQALQDGARIIVFPEMAVCGYPPMDLLTMPRFIEENALSLRHLQHELPHGIAVVVGFVQQAQKKSGKPIHNAAAVLENGQCIHTQAKRLLPTYDVFDEARYFEPGENSTVFSIDDEYFGIAICEDLWWEHEPESGVRYPQNPVQDLLDQGARTILCPSASPFAAGKIYTRQNLLRKIGESGAAVVYCNMVGANDNLIFDGRSMLSNRQGRILHISPGFESSVQSCLLDNSANADQSTATYQENKSEAIYNALTLGIRDYMKKTGFKRAHLGLSGGIDSALTAVLAVQALGPENVHCFFLPSPHSREESGRDAETLARNLGTEYDLLPIEEGMKQMNRSMSALFAGKPEDTTEENIQARLRGLMLMAYSNKFASLLLTTGNKSELAVGYCTLYGDMCGGLAVIGDVLQTEVYELCRWINRDTEIIPDGILTRPPSAELRPDQRDQDSLPEYEILDGILSHHVLENMDAPAIIAAGYQKEDVQLVLNLIARAEYKRVQAPPVLKVSHKAFGTGRRIPIARTIFESAGPAAFPTDNQ